MFTLQSFSWKIHFLGRRIYKLVLHGVKCSIKGLSFKAELSFLALTQQFCTLLRIEVGCQRIGGNLKYNTKYFSKPFRKQNYLELQSPQYTTYVMLDEFLRDSISYYHIYLHHKYFSS